jgi:hypothetical protein
MDATVLTETARCRRTANVDRSSTTPGSGNRARGPSLAARVRRVLTPDPASQGRISTPTLLRWGLVSVVGATAVAVPVALLAVGRLQAAAVAIADEHRPTFLLSEQVAVTTADMAAQITASALGQGQAFSRYGADVTASVDQITAAIGAARNDPGEITLLEQLQLELRHYAQLVGASSVTSPDVVVGNEQLAKTQTLWAARAARTAIVPLAQEATDQAARRLANAEREFLDQAQGAGRQLGAALVVLLAALGTTQLVITRRTRRLINIPLALGTVVVLGALGWSVSVIRTADSDVAADAGRIENLRQLFDAEITVHQMKADQSMWLFELRTARYEQRALRATYGRYFAQEAGRLIDVAGIAKFAGDLTEDGGWTDPVDYTALDQIMQRLQTPSRADQGASPCAGGLRDLGASLSEAGILGEQLAHRTAAGIGCEAADDALSALLSYLEVDRHIRRTALGASRDDAVLLSIGDSDGSANAAFARLVAGLEQLVSIDIVRSDATGHDLVAALARLRIGLLAALTAALLLAVPGIWQRYREYL